VLSGQNCTTAWLKKKNPEPKGTGHLKNPLQLAYLSHTNIQMEQKCLLCVRGLFLISGTKIQKNLAVVK